MVIPLHFLLSLILVRKLLIILFISCYTVCNILLPDIGIGALRSMYTQCAGEDPDINIPDFVLEHLLHMPDCFEQEDEHDEEEHEKPHQPFHISGTAYNIAVNIQEPYVFLCQPQATYNTTTRLSSLYLVHMPKGCFSNVFRPPAV